MENFRRFAPFKICYEDFQWYWRKKTGKKLAYFGSRRGEKLELLAKTFTLAVGYISCKVPLDASRYISLVLIQNCTIQCIPEKSAPSAPLNCDIKSDGVMLGMQHILWEDIFMRRQFVDFVVFQKTQTQIQRNTSKSKNENYDLWQSRKVGGFLILINFCRL